MWEELTKRIQRKIIGSQVQVIDGDNSNDNIFAEIYKGSFLIIVEWDHDGTPYFFRQLIRKEIHDQMSGDALLDHLTADISRQIDNIVRGNTYGV